MNRRPSLPDLPRRGSRAMPLLAAALTIIAMQSATLATAQDAPVPQATQPAGLPTAAPAISPAPLTPDASPAPAAAPAPSAGTAPPPASAPLQTPATAAPQAPADTAAPQGQPDTAAQPDSGIAADAAQNSDATQDLVESALPVPADGEPEAQPIVLHDLSPWGMYEQADIVVKAVMIGLAFASFVTWTVFLAKSLELAAAKASARRVLGTIVRARSTHEAAERTERSRGVNALMLRAATDEIERSQDLPADGIKERVLASLTRLEAHAARRMTRGMGVLATIGATAPFVGLFGTVWGIMNSFIGIAESQTTNLAVVAPGIAEALLATAIGLIAAIPAVVIYNVFTRSIGGYRALLSDASAEILRHVSRDLDRRDTPHRLAAAAE